MALERRWPTRVGGGELGGMARLTMYGGETWRYAEWGGERGALPATIELAGLSTAIVVEAPLIAGIRAGMDLDLIGLGVGPSRSVDSRRGRPPVFSRLLYGNADRGALNSEFYAAVSLTPSMTLRARISHYATG